MQNESWQRAIAESRSWTEEEASRALAACVASGMTMAAFAREHGGTAGRFQYWGRRLRTIESEGRARLLPVRVVGQGQARLVERDAGRVVLMQGRLRVEIEGMAPEWVGRLLVLLRGSESEG
jgi:transposase-like protein